MDLQTLIDEYASAGIGESLYGVLRAVVPRVIRRHGYPPSYSPTGQWDDDAFSGLAHDWTMDKLLRYGQLEHLLLSNQTLSGFEQGLELSFRHFLISQRARSTLTNLFRRAAFILEHDPSFRLFIDVGQKAARFWGLASWQTAEPFAGSDSDLIAAGFRLPDIPVIRYRSDARKLSPILSDRALARFIELLLEDLQACLNLSQILIALKYRFNLLEASEISIEEVLPSEESDRSLRLADTLSGGSLPDEEILVSETAATVLRELSPRQRRVLRAYVQPDATLTSVAEQVGCSKSTVDNELRRASAIIHRHAGGLDEARAVYERLIDALDESEKVGNSGR